MVTGGKYANDVYVFTIMKQTRYGTECIVQTYLLREKKSSPEITNKYTDRYTFLEGIHKKPLGEGLEGQEDYFS